MSWDPRAFQQDLEAAVEVFDHERASRLCDQLILHLRSRDDGYPADHARKVLKALRGKRYFCLLQRVADTLIQNDLIEPLVRRFYVQSQLDKGNITAAISTLEILNRETAPTDDTTISEEHAECLGLFGRAYKQLYVDADQPDRSRNQNYLRLAIEFYNRGYKADCSRFWHGINTVALIHRAEADGVELPGMPDLRLRAKLMASEILSRIEALHQERKAENWDFASAVEACVGLGRNDEAVIWLGRYLRNEYTDAFELASTLRQLTEVWRIDQASPPGDRILPALKAKLLRQKGSALAIDTEAAFSGELGEDQGYEQILGQDTFQSVKWFRKCLARSRAVARIETRSGNAMGTGFVVRGCDFDPRLGDDLLVLTNAHVVSNDPKVRRALRPEKAILEFELWDEGGSELEVDQVWSSPPDELDATLLRVRTAIPPDVEPLPVTSTIPAVDGQQRAYVIGHPQGRRLSFSIHDTKLLDNDDRVLHYRSPTEPGSSGSPVFNEDWEVIALHHAGLQRMPMLHEEGTYPANEGILIEAIKRGVAQRREN